MIKIDIKDDDIFKLLKHKLDSLGTMENLIEFMKILENQFILKSLIGSGTYGYVFRGHEIKTQNEFAFKICFLRNDQNIKVIQNNFNFLNKLKEQCDLKQFIALYKLSRFGI